MNFSGIRQAAINNCVDILTTLTPISPEIENTSEDLECPICGHGSLHPDRRDGGVNAHGRVRCHNCCEKGTGDVIDTVKVFGKYESQVAAARAIMEHLGLSMVEAVFAKPNIIEAVAQAKRMPLDAFMQFGPVATKRGREKTEVARVPVYDAKGEIHSHFDLTPTGKGWCKKGKGNSGMFLPGKLPKPGETWLLVEGVKDAAALVGMGYNAAGLPTCRMPQAYASLFKDVNVITVADLDVAGQDGAKQTGGRLSGVAKTILVARLPGEIVESKGADVRDVIKSNGEQAVRDAIEHAMPWTPRDCDILAKDERPEEILTLRYAWHVDRVIGHLGKLGWTTTWIPEAKRECRKLYQRGGELVGVVTETKADATAKGGKIKIAIGTPRSRPLPTSQLALRIADSCQLITEKETSEGEIEKKAVPPPRWLVDGIHSMGDYGDSIRHLEAIVTAPTIRPDGSILQKPGWDASGLLFRPSMKFDPIPDKPSQEDAKKAAERLFEVVADFPFTADADKSAWLAMTLSMIGRPCIVGQTPLFAITANTRGAGKTLLVDAASIIAYGHTAARTSYASDDDEMRKRITSLIIEGSPAVLLDNIDRPIGGASLDAVLTAERWKDRELGSSRTIDLPARTVWTATGNNLRFRSDIARRVVPIRLDSPLERPETRSDFRHADLLGWTREHRGELVTAALVILRAYFVAGCPKQPGGQFGSFESWSDTIRGAAVWAGCVDPMATIETAQTDDDSAALVVGLIGGLLELDRSGHGLTANEIVQRVTADFAGELYPTMREAIAESASKNGKPDVRRLGGLLAKYRGRATTVKLGEDTPATFKIHREEGHARTRLWSARKVESSSHRGDSGDSGDSATTQCEFQTMCVSPNTHTHTQNSDTHTHAYRVGPAELSPTVTKAPKSEFHPANDGVLCGDSAKRALSPSAVICKCGVAMESTPAEPGWVTFECLLCGEVRPMRETWVAV